MLLVGCGITSVDWSASVTFSKPFLVTSCTLDNCKKTIFLQQTADLQQWLDKWRAASKCCCCKSYKLILLLLEAYGQNNLCHPMNCIAMGRLHMMIRSPPPFSKHFRFNSNCLYVCEILSDFTLKECNHYIVMANKLAKARKTRTWPATLGLKNVLAR